MASLPKRSMALTSPPHLRDNVTTQKLMRNVIIALMPTAIAAVLLFGLSAFILIVVTVASCVGFEYLWCRLRKEDQTIGDLSAVVTGLLLAFNLPSTLPLYMAVIGAFVSIILVKELFGGLGKNFANPAAVGRIVLAVSFPSAMTNFVTPQLGMSGFVDAVSSSTPLAPTSPAASLVDLFFGFHAGVLGETCVFAILLGLVWLLVTRTITITIPAVYIATVMVLSFFAGQDPVARAMEGGLLLGAIFMATDYVTSPSTVKGQIVFAVGLGLITCLIRFYGNLNEGVAYSILLMNLLVPYINSLTMTRPLGAEKESRFRKKKKAEKEASNAQ
ncbi:MAG: RnfABCDGE type electron transport complex subunit D [Eggerthellaceae bacterium]